MEPRAGVTLVNAGPGCSDVNLQWHQLTSPIERRLALPEHARHPSLPVCLSPLESECGGGTSSPWHTATRRRGAPRSSAAVGTRPEGISAAFPLHARRPHC